jgi:hypothetical protein
VVVATEDAREHADTEVEALEHEEQHPAGDRQGEPQGGQVHHGLPRTS